MKSCHDPAQLQAAGPSDGAAMSEDTLQYPAKLAKDVGLGVNEINALKQRGCPFYGRKTTLRVVRAFIYRVMGAESLLEPAAYPQHSGASKSGAREKKND